MININLVPDNFKKQGHSWLGFLEQINIPKEILLGEGSIFFAVLIIVHVFLAGGWIVAQTQHITYQNSWKKMLPDKNNLETISQQIKDLNFRMSTINDFAVKKSIVWSQKLNDLSDLMPKGLWFKKIIWDNSVFVIEGTAFSKLFDEITLVGDFVSNLKKDEGFIKDFSSIGLDSITRSKRGMIEVVDFKITAKVK
jgi:hypothetical protein